MRVLSVVGARPQFVKLAPIADALRMHGHDHLIIHTGQHYDPEMSDVFFRDLGIPAPERHLAVGSGSHGRQTGAMLAGLEDVLEETRPDWVLVYGDTNSTLAGAIAAVKLGLPLAHLEAGLRSFNRRMPEEHNRVLTDHAADICLAPTEVAMANLRREGLGHVSVMVGDVMTDVLYRVRAGVAGHPPKLPEDIDPSTPYYLATLHRAENTDDPQRLSEILSGLGTVEAPVLLLAHPRLRQRAQDFGLNLASGQVRVLDPLPYPTLIGVVSGSAGVITDSGGLQKEAFLLRVPCTTVRTETEWTETVELGWNVLAPDPAEIPRRVRRPLPPPTDATPYGDGNAATRTVSALSGRVVTTTLTAAGVLASKD